MKVAVVGAGVFGITIAYKLARTHKVDLYEASNEILSAASGINQFRVHRGYHYPRSPETVSSNIESILSFQEEFKKAIVTNNKHYYAVAKNDSLTTGKDYVNFCKANNLFFKEVNLPVLNKGSIDLCLEVDENLIDPKILKQLLNIKLKHKNLNLFLKKKADSKILSNYDKVIICTYANINFLLSPKNRHLYQYEICEKIVVKLPDNFKNKSIVVLDGPFMCIDPYGDSEYFLLGNVVHAIHHRNIGKKPDVPLKFNSLLNKGIISNPPFTNFKKFIETGEQFIPEIKNAKFVGSMFTIRTVLPFKEKTDDRPTIVNKVDDKYITVFSGKLVSCVTAAVEVEKLIKD